MPQPDCTIAHVLMFVERRVEKHYRKVMPYMADIRHKVLSRAAHLADENGVIPGECLWELFEDPALSPEEKQDLGAWLVADIVPISVCTAGI